jgi:ABC-type cobalt transport system substrate-binding protein
MKQKDILLVVVVAIVAVVVSVAASKVLFVSSDNRKQEVEVVEEIGTTFTPPSSTYFNASSVNPTQNIQIGTSTNPTPFNNKAQ